VITPHIIGFIVTLGGIIFATRMLRKKEIHEPTYCFLLLLSIFGGIWVGYSDRAKEFTVGPDKVSISLQEIREAQADVQKREEHVKQLASLTGDLITFVEGTSLGFGGPKAQDEWLRIKLDELGSLSGVKIDNPFTRRSQQYSALTPNDTSNQALLKQIQERYEKDLAEEVQRLKAK